MRDELAVAQDGDLVADAQHLGQLVRDVDRRAAARGEGADRLEERLRILRPEHRRRLVEEDHARPAEERPRDLDLLPVGHAEVAHDRVRVELRADSREEARRHRALRAAVDQPAPDDLAPEQDVLRDGHRRHEGELLRDEIRGDPPLPSRVDPDLAGIGPQRAGRAAHQRGLAGSVLAAQPEHAPGAERERHVAQHADGAEGLAQPADLEDVGHGTPAFRRLGRATRAASRAPPAGRANPRRGRISRRA